jgi:acetyltransferase-like isoleucine patch superfamily enzyme
MTKEFRNYKAGVRNVTFGTNVTVVEPVNLYECEVGNDVFIGPFVEIQVGVIIGEKSRIQSHTFVCEGVLIGKECFIGHGVMFINDLLLGGPAQGDKSKWGKTHVGDHVSIGSNSTILPVEICDHVVIGAGSVVTKSISEPGVYVGNPARKVS